MKVDKKYYAGFETEINGRIYRFSGWNTAVGLENFALGTATFKMPAASAPIRGEWTLVDDSAEYADYTVAWYDADQEQDTPLEGHPLVTRNAKIGDTVRVGSQDRTISGWTYKAGDPRNVTNATLGATDTALKLYFTKDKPVTPPDPEKEEGKLVIAKKVTGESNVTDEGYAKEFTFDIKLTLPAAEQESLEPSEQTDAAPENPDESAAPDGDPAAPNPPDDQEEPPDDTDEPKDPDDSDKADVPENPDKTDNQEDASDAESEPDVESLEKLSYEAGEEPGEDGDILDEADAGAPEEQAETGTEPVTIMYTVNGAEHTFTFEEDTATATIGVQLKHGQSAEFTLPAGTVYSVSEEPEDGYTSSLEGEVVTREGTIVKGETHTVIFVNTKDAPVVPDPETYTVTYQWSGRVPSRAERPVDGSDYEEGSRVAVDDNYTRNTTIYQGRYTYTFSGWYMDENLTERAGASFTMPDHDVTLYGYWERERDDDPYEPDPTPPTPPKPDPDPEPEPQPEPEPTPPLPERPVDPGTGMVPDDPTVLLDDLVPLAALHLNVTDHYAYIIGYPDGMVKPLGSITRAEVATVFFRLMLDEYRQENWATENDFPDVTADKWYNNAVSTCAKAGIIKGYPDGTFRPNATITRAEFAAIAARFVSDDVPGYDYFTDMDGHWAQIDVARAVMAGWIKGEGRLFRPNDLMNRAETATLVNRMINRFPDKEHLLEGMIIWPDNPQPPMEKWFYEDIQEATNSHDYEAGDFTFAEIWTYLLANRDWAALETEWANAADAPGGEVAPDLQPGGSEDSQGEEPDLSELLPGLMG